MSLDDTWFTETHGDAGTAFSLKAKAKLHEEQTPYQKIEIYETEGFGNLMVIDGCTMLTTRDNFIYHEMMSHVALFTHPNPKRVLIIGGGDCGTLKEVLKHDSVESVQQIDIDEGVTRLSKIYFPELCTSNDDPRAELMFIDGIQWVKDAEENSYDVIIIDSTDPVGPAEGLFSKPFYEECYRVLSDKGILVQQSESPLIHMNILRDMHNAMKGAGYFETKTAFFPQCIYPTGWWSATMACKEGSFRGFRESDSANKNFSTRYYNCGIHHGALAAPEFFSQEIKE